MRYLSLILLITLFTLPTLAHDPYLEEEDWGDFASPYIVPDSEISYAFYGYIDEADYDVFAIDFPEAEALLRIELLVPECGEHYSAFYPDYAILAPNVESNDASDFPFEMPEGYGLLLHESYEPSEDNERETFLEPFGGTTFYTAPRHDITLDATGLYYVVVFDADANMGDYSLAVGYEERFEGSMMEAMNTTAQIRSNGWLHRDCALSPDNPDAIIHHEHGEHSEHDEHHEHDE